MGIKRRFVDVAHGQMHVRHCGDPALPALVMFHGSPGSGYSLMPLAAHLATGRHVIAIDTAGNGDSAPLPNPQPSIAELAAAHGEAMEALGITRADLYGYHTGAAICTELAIAHPDRVGRIIMDGLSVFQPDEAQALLARDHAPPIPVDHDGTQFAAAWSMVRDAHLFWPWWDRSADARRILGLPTAAYLHGEVLEVLKACGTYCRSYNAALRYNKRERLKLIRNEVLVTACPSDQLFPHLERAAPLIEGALIRVSAERAADGGKDAAALMLAFLEGHPI